MKFRGRLAGNQDHCVAPLVGAWIEIDMEERVKAAGGVAPLVGAWIEIRKLANKVRFLAVAPLVGAWIEIEKFIR